MSKDKNVVETRNLKGGWTVTNTVDEHGKTIFKKHKHNGKPAASFELSTEVKGVFELKGYALILRDLDSAIAWLEFAESINASTNATNAKQSEERISALFVASITFYGKCFSRADVRKITLNTNWVEEKFIELHEQLIKARNNFTAHSGYGDWEDVFVTLAIRPHGKGKVETSICWEWRQTYQLNNLGEILMLFRDIQAKVQSKVSNLESEIYHTQIEPDLQQWVKKAKKQLRKK